MSSRPSDTTCGSAQGRMAPMVGNIAGASQNDSSRGQSVGGAVQPPWTQTGVRSGMMPLSQIQSIAGTLTRTHPCEAG